MGRCLEDVAAKYRTELPPDSRAVYGSMLAHRDEFAELGYQVLTPAAICESRGRIPLPDVLVVIRHKGCGWGWGIRMSLADIQGPGCIMYNAESCQVADLGPHMRGMLRAWVVAAEGEFLWTLGEGDRLRRQSALTELLLRAPELSTGMEGILGSRKVGEPFFGFGLYPYVLASRLLPEEMVPPVFSAWDAESWWEAGDAARAEALLEGALSHGSQSGALLWALGCICACRGDVDRTSRLYLEALVSDWCTFDPRIPFAPGLWCAQPTVMREWIKRHIGSVPRDKASRWLVEAIEADTDGEPTAWLAAMWGHIHREEWASARQIALGGFAGRSWHSGGREDLSQSARGECCEGLRQIYGIKGLTSRVEHLRRFE